MQVGDPARVAFNEGSVTLPADLSKVGLDGGYLLEEEHQPRVALVCLQVGAVAGLDHGIRRGGRVDVVPNPGMQHFVLDCLEYGVEYRFLAGEVGVEGSRRAVALTGEVREARVDVPVAFEDPAGRRHERRSGAHPSGGDWGVAEEPCRILG